MVAVKDGVTPFVPFEVHLMRVFLSSTPEIDKIVRQRVNTLRKEEQKKQDAVKAKKLPADEEAKELEALGRKDQTREEFCVPTGLFGAPSIFGALPDEAYQKVLSGEETPDSDDEGEEKTAGYFNKFVPSWASKTYCFIVSTVMGVLEPEAVRRRNTSDKMTTEDAIGDTDKFLVQLATAIHIAVHYSNLDNILSNKEGQQTGKARARLTKATRKELAHHYHIWLWMLQQSSRTSTVISGRR